MPVAGLLAAVAGVGCGFTANLLIVTTDVLLGISAEAAAGSIRKCTSCN
ncbi:AbgT family transporter [Escherichia coli]